MQTRMWIFKYLAASGVLFIILSAVEWSKGSPATGDFLGALAWSMLSAALFVGSQYWRARKAASCAACDADRS
ncbi:MAG: hypothetical protein V4754_01930 [Pseudomonadota bacterium]